MIGGDEEDTVCSLLASCPILSQAEERLFPRIQVMQQCSQMEGKAASLNPGAQGSNLGYSSGEDAMKKISVAEQSCNQLQMQEPYCVIRLTYFYICGLYIII